MTDFDRYHPLHIPSNLCIMGGLFAALPLTHWGGLSPYLAISIGSALMVSGWLLVRFHTLRGLKSAAMVLGLNFVMYCVPVGVIWLIGHLILGWIT